MSDLYRVYLVLWDFRLPWIFVFCFAGQRIAVLWHLAGIWSDKFDQMVAFRIRYHAADVFIRRFTHSFHFTAIWQTKFSHFSHDRWLFVMAFGAKAISHSS
jgi:hypothetical protein